MKLMLIGIWLTLLTTRDFDNLDALETTVMLVGITLIALGIFSD